MRVTKTYYLIKVVGEDRYFSRTYANFTKSSVDFFSEDISKHWYTKESYAKGHITSYNKIHTIYDRTPPLALEVVPVQVTVDFPEE